MAESHLVLTAPQLSHHAKLWFTGAAVALAGTLALGIYFAVENWPYRYRKVKPLLEDVFGSQVRLTQFHRTYFPQPGFVAEDLTLTRKSAPDQQPIGKVARLVVQGTWIDMLLLRRRVQKVEMDNVHVIIPPPGSRAMEEDFPPGSSGDFTGPETLIEQLEIKNSMFEVLRKEGGRYSFPIHVLRLEHFHEGDSVSYQVDLQNAIPSGRIVAHGRFGPLRAQDVGATPVSGQFTFTQVRLQDVGKIHGTLTANGGFDGKLQGLEAEARSETADFAVEDGRRSEVTGTVRCLVNGLTGEVQFHSIEAHTGATVIHATGGVQGSPKITNLEIEVKQGRAEDLLRPFLRKETPVVGRVVLRSHAVLGPSGRGIGFLQRLHVTGAFEMPAERATDQQIEKSLTQFSERADGKKRKDEAHGAVGARASLRGRAAIANAVVSTHELEFEVAGARARLGGTFNLHTSAVHLTGELAMRADISHAMTGFKSMLLKPLAPFFRKKKAGAEIPIAVTGTAGHYKVQQDLAHDK